MGGRSEFLKDPNQSPVLGGCGGWVLGGGREAVVGKGEKSEVGENERGEGRGGERQRNGERRDVQGAWGGGGRWLGKRRRNRDREGGKWRGELWTADWGAGAQHGAEEDKGGRMPRDWSSCCVCPAAGAGGGGGGGGARVLCSGGTGEPPLRNPGCCSPLLGQGATGVEVSGRGV